MNKFDLFEEEDAIDEVEIAIESEEESAITETETAIESKPNKWQENGNKPWKNEDQKYTEGFYSRCTKPEKEAIEAEAASYEMSKSRFLISKGLYAKRVLSREEIEIASTIVAELTRISGNINQIAKATNSSRMRGEIVELTQKQLFSVAETAKQIALRSAEMIEKFYGNPNSNNQ
jgi:cystathionine beta-lyase/cystathionine gamma-synthase